MTANKTLTALTFAFGRRPGFAFQGRAVLD